MDSAAPIPPPIQDDDEDVHWALSTAAALWGRGERVEALKWLRRAAEQASDINADARALHLFKAAADLASEINAGSMFPPPSSTAMVSEGTPSSSEYSVSIDGTPSSFPPPPPRAPSPAPSSFPPPPPGTGVPRPAAGALPPPPAPPRKKAAPPSLPAPPPARPPSIPAPAAPARPLPVPSAPPPPMRPAARADAPPAFPAPRSGPGAAKVPVPTPSSSMAARPPAPPPPGSTSGARPPAGGPVPEAVPRSSTAKTSKMQGQATRPAAARAPEPEPSKPFELQVKRTPAVQNGGVGRSAARPEERKRAGSEKRAVAAMPPSAPLTEPGVPEGVTERPPQPQTFDDLDDVTRVLEGSPALKAPAVPGARKGTVQQIDDDFRRMLGSRPSLTDELSYSEDDADERTDARIPLMPVDAPAPPPVAEGRPEPRAEAVPAPVSPPSPVPVPAPQAPAAVTPRPELLAPPTETTSRRVAPLLSFRVAILATGTPGEVRLVALDGAGQAPEGAAQAILVPLSAADGEMVAKLFGSLE
jgi:hypothetical protein